MLELVEALYDYNPSDASQLHFQAGSQILIIHKNSTGWWYGSLGGEKGWIPSNYINQKDSKQLPDSQKSNLLIANEMTMAAEDLLMALDSNDEKLIMEKARHLGKSIRRLPQHKQTRKVDKKLSAVFSNPPDTIQKLTDELEEIAYQFLDMIESVDFAQIIRPSTNYGVPIDLDTSRPMVTPISPDVQGNKIVFNSCGKVKSGSKKSLLEYLTNPEKSDIVYLRIFLTTYSLHFKSTELLDHLKNVFNSNTSFDPYCNRVINIMTIWLEDFLPLKNEGSLFFKSFYEFITDEVGLYSPEVSSKFLVLLKRVKNMQKIRRTSDKVMDVFISRIQSINLSECNPAHVGTELHNIYIHLFNRIQYSDWIKKNALELESISSLIKFSKFVSKWVQVLILKEENLSKQVQNIKVLIKICRSLYALKNFQGVKDIINEMRSEALRNVMLEIGLEDFEMVKTLLTIVRCQDHKYAMYHSELNFIEGSFFPLLIAHCKSIMLVHSQVGNMTSCGLINFSKMAILSYNLEKMLLAHRHYLV